MKKTAIALALSGLVFASVAQAAPQANTFYAGYKVGWASTHQGLKRVGADFGLGYNRNSVTHGIYGGWQIIDNLAVEIGYDDFGSVKFRNRGSDQGYVLKNTNHGFHFSVKGSYPVLETLDIYGRVGLGIIRSDYKPKGDLLLPASLSASNDGNSEPQPVSKVHSLKASAIYAVGLEYAIIPQLALRLEWQWVNKVGKFRPNGFERYDYTPSINSVSLGLSYRFGQQPQVEEVVNKRFAFSSDVLFDFNKSNLKAGGEESLNNMQGEITKLGLASPAIDVAGYTDRIGSDAYNLKLSQKRAETVANYLVSTGSPQENITAVGYGKANPVTGSTCDSVNGRKALIACLAPDRRVEVAVKGSKAVAM